MKLLRTLVPPTPVTTFVALAILVGASPAQAQQWPTADPSYSGADPALATGPEAFGSAGQIVVSSDFHLDVGYDWASGVSDSGITSLRVAPAMMFFIVRNLAVGGLLDFQYESNDTLTITQFVVQPQLAYHLALGPRTSLLPGAGLLYGWQKTRLDVLGGTDSSSDTAWGIDVRAPLLFHPFTHVFVGLAPFFRFELASESDDRDAPKGRSFGVSLILGFWL